MPWFRTPGGDVHNAGSTAGYEGWEQLPDPPAGMAALAWDAAKIAWSAAPPVYDLRPSPLAFFDLFTVDEEAAIRASTIPAVVRAVGRAGAATEYIDLADPTTRGMIAGLAMLELITPARAAVIVNGMPPS